MGTRKLPGNSKQLAQIVDLNIDQLKIYGKSGHERARIISAVRIVEYASEWIAREHPFVGEKNEKAASRMESALWEAVLELFEKPEAFERSGVSTAYWDSASHRLQKAAPYLQSDIDIRLRRLRRREE